MNKFIIICFIVIMFHIYPLLCYTKLPRLSYSRLSKINAPFVLYRTWSSNYVNNKMFKNCHQRWLELNNNISIEWFTDHDCNQYMLTQDKSVQECYKILKPGAFKADLFRLCILYERGGIYVDAHTIPYISIRQMIKGYTTENLFISVLDSVQTGRGIHNGFIICSPKHPFIKAGIQRIIQNVQNRCYTDHILGVTGPICLSKAINTVLGLPENNTFKEGKNEYSNLSFYLYRLEFGPSQYIYKGNSIIMSKKHCTLSYITHYMQKSYARSWKNKNIFTV